VGQAANSDWSQMASALTRLLSVTATTTSDCFAVGLSSDCSGADPGSDCSGADPGSDCSVDPGSSFSHGSGSDCSDADPDSGCFLGLGLELVDRHSCWKTKPMLR
jgi:hypothetical protein